MSILYELQHDPVLASKVIMDIDLPPHERVRMRAMWTPAYFNDSSGYTTGKTFCIALISALRAVLFDERIEGIISHTFGGVKIIFRYIDIWYASKPKFRSQFLKPPTHANDGHLADFKNGSQIRGLPPDIVRSSIRLHSERFSDCILDEAPRYAKSEVIDDVIDSRVTKPCPLYDKTGDPIYQNHTAYFGTADYIFHPFYKSKVKRFMEETKKGNPDYVYQSWNYEDVWKFPKWKWLIPEKVVREAEKTLSPVKFAMVWLGKWQKASASYYPAEKVMVSLRKNFINVEIRGDAKSTYIMGIDVAPVSKGKGSDFAIDLLKMEAKGVSMRYQIRKNNIGLSEMAGIVYGLYNNFNIPMIMCDPGGGGAWLAKELSKDEQIINGVTKSVTPILPVDDISEISGCRILVMFSRSDSYIKEVLKKLKGDDELANKAHDILKNRIERETILFPKDVREFDIAKKTGKLILRKGAEEELKIMADIENALSELIGLGPTKDRLGNPKLTKNGFFTFNSTGKDSAMSLVYASMGVYIYEEMSKKKDEEDAPIGEMVVEDLPPEEPVSEFEKMAIASGGDDGEI